MPGGPIAPYSAIPTNANVFENLYSGLGANSIQEMGYGVAASLPSDSTWRLRFKIPPIIPSGTFKLDVWTIANASSGAAKLTVKDKNVASGSSPSSTTLTSETQQTITWTVADVYIETKIALTPTPAGNDVLVCDMVFNTTGWTLAVISTWWPWLIWE
jgi:hypothetical protein